MNVRQWWQNGRAFTLDGMRLMKKAGGLFDPNEIYTPENNPHQELIFYNWRYSGTEYMETDVNGVKYTYGKSTSRQSFMSNNVYVLCAMYITSAVDSYGNSIHYEYFNDSLAHYPSAITYGNGNRVEFVYDDRTNDAIPFIMAGRKGLIQKRLKRIVSKCGSDVFRSYELNYDTISDGTGVKFSRLVSVTESNGNETLNPITLDWEYLPGFGWSHSNKYVPVSTESNPSNYDKTCFMSSDMNGDGVDDIVQLSTKTISSGSLVYVHTYVYPSSINSSSAVSYGSPKKYTMESILPTFNDTHSVVPFGDFDGDGKSDFITTTSQLIGIYNNEELYKVRVQILHGSGLSDVGNTSPLHHDILINKGSSALYTVADFNRDGRSELFLIEQEEDNNMYKYHYVRYTDNLGVSSNDFSISLYDTPTHVFSGDFNGDGLMDVIIFCGYRYTILYNDGGTGNDNPFYAAYSFTGPMYPTIDHIYQGDFNGDGMSDFVFCRNHAPTYYFLLCNGDGTFDKLTACTIDIWDQTTNKDDERFSCIVTDFDHDGKSDLLVGKAQYNSYNNNYSETRFRWLRSTGDSLVEEKRTTTAGEEDARPENILVGDFTGNGRQEVMNYGNNIWLGSTASVGVHLYTDAMTPSKGRITSIHDGLSNTTIVNYASLTNSGVYEKNASSNYPLVVFTPPLAVVSEVVESNGSVGNAHNTYNYGDFMVHTKGKGLLGFGKISRTDHVSLLTVTSEQFAWDSRYFVPISSRNKTQIDGYISTHVDSVSLDTTTWKAVMAYPITTTATDIYGNVTTTTRTYDTAKGVPTMERTEYGSANMYKQVVYSDYVQKNNMWLPQTITATQKHSDDATTFSVTTQIAYDENGRQTSVTENAQSDLALTTAYSYDSYGNVSSKTVSGEGVDSLRTVYIYQNGRDLSEQYTIPASAHSTYTYDTCGNMLTSTDVTDTSNPLTTTYTYDGWGRTLTATDPTGAVTSTSRGWGTTLAKKYWTIEERPSSPWVKTWYDSRGREVLTESVGEDCIQLSKETSYDSAGRKIRERHTTGRLVMDDTYSYDDLGRVDTINTRSGETTNYSYGNRTVTTNTANRTYSKTMDAWGNVKTSSDPVSNVTYTYGPAGNPVEVTAAGSTVSLSYDDCGNRTSVSDPDAGTVTTEYDALGRVTRQTDARGMVTVNTYDALGRLTETVCDGTATTYTYGTEGGAAMQLTRQQTGSYAAAYTYDSYGRLTGETRTMPSESALVFGYTYDANGNIASRTYPGNVQVDYTYDSNGYKTQAKIGDRNVWRLDGYDGLTRVTAVTDGCLQHAERQDIFGRTESVTTWRGTNLADSMTFAYNQYTGNLTSRTGMQSSTETFSYDNLDRLTGVSVGGATQSAITYETNGNIYSKTGIGSYTYDTAKPHAVTEVENTAECIDTLCQTVIYNGFGRISHIDNTEFKMTFNYGPDRERWKTVIEEMPNASPFPGIDSLWTGPIGGDGLNGGGGMAFPIRTKGKILYGRDYEYYAPMASNKIHRYYYLDGGVLYHKETVSGRNELLFMQTDNIGSIRRIYGKTGTTVFEATYDAWGRRTVSKDSIAFRRGYTGHEHMKEFSLINMNGRLYDPLLGRFLSPDPYVQLPDFSQNYNRYSYCLNNPLKYNDPSGELFGIDDFVFAFAIFNMANSMMQAAFNGNNIWKAGGLSLLSSAATYGIGSAFGGVGKFGHELLRAGVHGISGGIFTSLDGGNFGNGFISSAISSGIGSFAQGVKMGQGLMIGATTLIGGFSAGATGGDFFQGAMQGMQIGLLNHAMHDGEGGIIYYRDQNGNIYGEIPEVVVRPSTGPALALQSAFAVGSAATIFFEHNNYSKTFNQWRGKNGKLYIGLTGRGPNQYTGSRALAKAKALKFNKAGRLLGGISTGYSAYEAYYTKGLKSIEYGLDAFMGATGFIPEAGPFISLYWILGGKQLHQMWINEVVRSQFNLGIIGLPSTMPFK